MTAGTRSVTIRVPRRLERRHIALFAGIALGVTASLQATAHNLGLVPLLVVAIVPHLTVLAGIGQPRARGQLGPRAVPLFNVMHHPALPVAVLGLAAVGVLSPFWLVSALAWLGHIVFDLGLGDGLRTADGWRRR